jgi:hypothetical protein
MPFNSLDIVKVYFNGQQINKGLWNGSKVLGNYLQSNLLSTDTYTHTSSINYTSTTLLTLANNVSISTGETLRLRGTINYNVKAYNTSNSASFSVKFGSLNKYITIFSMKPNASITEYVSGTYEMDITFTSQQNINASSASYLKTILEVASSYKIGITSIGNLSLVYASNPGSGESTVYTAIVDQAIVDTFYAE